jgi:hypothetical protein
MALTKVVLHHSGPSLRDAQVGAHVADHLVHRHGTDAAERIGFDILVQQFIRIQFRTVLRGDSFEFNRRFTVINGLNVLGTNPLRGTGKLSPCP